MKVGDLVVHGRGTIYPHGYLLGVILREVWGENSFEKLFDVFWFHSAKKQLIREATLISLEVYNESR